MGLVWNPPVCAYPFAERGAGDQSVRVPRGVCGQAFGRTQQHWQPHAGHQQQAAQERRTHKLRWGSVAQALQRQAPAAQPKKPYCQALRSCGQGMGTLPLQ